VTGQPDSALYTALVRLHSAESRALELLYDAEASLAAYDEHLVRRKAQLRTLGYDL